MPRYLVIAYQTAENPALIRELRALADGGGAEFVLLVPATASQHLRLASIGEAYELARDAALSAEEKLRGEGIEPAAVRVRDPNPVVAAADELAEHPGYDGIVLSTFPAGMSRWLRMDLPRRLQRTTGLPVTHVVAEEPPGPDGGPG